jgi:hypothetical protein
MNKLITRLQKLESYLNSKLRGFVAPSSKERYDRDMRKPTT